MVRADARIPNNSLRNTSVYAVRAFPFITDCDALSSSNWSSEEATSDGNHARQELNDAKWNEFLNDACRISQYFWTWVVPILGTVP